MVTDCSKLGVCNDESGLTINMVAIGQLSDNIMAFDGSLMLWRKLWRAQYNKVAVCTPGPEPHSEPGRMPDEMS